MSAIDELFKKLRGEKRKALMPFVTACDPDLDFTAAVLQEFARRRRVGSQRGGITRQEGRDYEPASVLLDRIRTQCAATAQSNGARPSNAKRITKQRRKT